MKTEGEERRKIREFILGREHDDSRAIPSERDHGSPSETHQKTQIFHPFLPQQTRSRNTFRIHRISPPNLTRTSCGPSPPSHSETSPAFLLSPPEIQQNPTFLPLQNSRHHSPPYPPKLRPDTRRTTTFPTPPRFTSSSPHRPNPPQQTVIPFFCQKSFHLQKHTTDLRCLNQLSSDLHRTPSYSPEASLRPNEQQTPPRASGCRPRTQIGRISTRAAKFASGRSGSSEGMF